MGREWYWGGSKFSKRGGGGVRGEREGEGERDSASTPSGCMCAVFQLFDFHLFQFANLHQQASFKSNSFLPEESPKGTEAPRNSLELEEPPLSSTLKEDGNLNIPMGIQIKTNADTTRSKVHGALSDSSFSEISSSPGGPKTPNLVARLMGLDLLPDHSYSPSSPSTLGTTNLQRRSHSHRHLRPQQPLQGKAMNHRSCLGSDVTGTRSLPETPRISSARRSDVDHRLSLQINKENMSISEELVPSRISSLKRNELKTEEENRSPSNYARQIVKQVKESVSRKVGLDITNTVKNRDPAGRDELGIGQFKSKKISKALTKVVDDDSSPGKYSTSSCSPRIKILEPKNKQITTVPSTKIQSTSYPPKSSLSTSSQVNIVPQNTKALINPNLQPVQDQGYHHHHHQQRPIKKCKKVGEDRFGTPPRLKKPPQTSDIIRNKQEEPFVSPTTAARANIPDKKCKKTTLSNDLLSITVPTLLPVKKDPTPPATKIPQKQVSNAQESKRSSSQLSSCSSHSYKQQAATLTLNARDSNNKNNNNNEDRSNGAAAAATASTTGDEAAEHDYITRILRRTGIEKGTPVSSARWFSPSNPLDPSIFYYLEHFTFVTTSVNKSYPLGQLSQMCNRKLLFHLVNEILVEILRPYLNMKPWTSSIIRRDFGDHMQGSHLVDMLCSKVRSFPCADCHVLEDIDALIDEDLPQLKVQSEVAFEQEGEGLVMEIEKDVLDTLLLEMAVSLYRG